MKLFLDLDGVLADFDRGVEAVTGKRPDQLPVRRMWQALAKAPDQPCSVTDDEGRPWYYQPNDARDVAQLLVLALEKEEALGESFNCGAPEPFLCTDGAKLLSNGCPRQAHLSLPFKIKFLGRWTQSCLSTGGTWGT